MEEIFAMDAVFIHPPAPHRVLGDSPSLASVMLYIAAFDFTALTKIAEASVLGWRRLERHTRIEPAGPSTGTIFQPAEALQSERQKS